MFPPRNRGFIPEQFAPQVEPQQEMQTNVGPSPQMMQQNPWGQYGSREGFRDAWMGRGRGVNIGDLQNFVQGTGAQIINPNSGVVRTPTGEVLDMGIGFSGGRSGQAGWTPILGEGGVSLGGGMQMPSLGPSMGMMNQMQQPQRTQPLRTQLGGGRTQSFGQATGYNQPQQQPQFGKPKPYSARQQAGSARY